MDIEDRDRSDVAHICEMRGAKEAHALADDSSGDVWIQLFQQDGFKSTYNNNITVTQLKKVLRVMEGLEEVYKCPVTVSWPGVKVEMTVKMNENSPVPDSVREHKEKDMQKQGQKETEMRKKIEVYLFGLKEKNVVRIDVEVMSLELGLNFEKTRDIVFKMEEEGLLALG